MDTEDITNPEYTASLHDPIGSQSTSFQRLECLYYVHNNTTLFLKLYAVQPQKVQIYVLGVIFNY